MSRGRPASAASEPPAADGAVAPTEIPADSWLQVLKRAGAHMMEARLPLLSAGIAFFAMLSIAPALATAISVYGVVTTSGEALHQLSQVAEMLPPQAQSLVAEQLTRITDASTGVLTVRGLVGLLIALWTATRAVSGLIDALTVAYHETETRGLVRRTGLALLFVLGGGLLLGALLLAAGPVARVVGAAPTAVRVVAAVAAWAGLGVLMSGGLAALYRFAPDRRDARWRWVTWGSTGATLVWVATSAAFFGYVRTLSTYETTYGSLAGVVISMVWVWVSVLLVVAGAAVNGESERQTHHDSTVGPDQPLGRRGAVVADTVPEGANAGERG